ncbi:O-antigen ligase family protein [Candidatus Saccharibacteria bacterium]|nr:O-antigen ligase family protein [Candidatus Saccharibacteria bacterium]
MKKNKNEGLRKIFCGMICILPAILFFSYHPIIRLGSGESMNFELSLPLVWLVLFDLFAGFLLIREKKLGGILKNWQWMLFPAFLSLSILWSANRTRGILTVGILWMIYFAVYAMFSLKDYFKDGFKEKFWKWFFGASLAVCAWCWVQSIVDLLGAGREVSLMCPGCTYQMFGFPHPNGFAIEPQFMGNLLLAPAIISIWMYMMSIKQNNKSLKLERSRGDNFYNGSVGAHKKLQFLDSLRDRCKNYAGSRFLCSKLLLFCFFVFASTLFLTFSRGAIYAFGVALLFMTIMRRATVRVWVITIVAFLFTLNAQGIMAQVSPTNDTYWSGVSKVLNHLSLGIIDIRQANAAEEAMFDGYVAESTETRVKLTDVAIKSWSKNWRRILFGVGLGGAGVVMYADGLMDWPKEIVQNEYASLLLETGLVGMALLAFSLWLVFKVVSKRPDAGMFLVLFLAYGVTLLFFSGLPNALHIYLLPAVLMLVDSKVRSGRS